MVEAGAGRRRSAATADKLVRTTVVTEKAIGSRVSSSAVDQRYGKRCRWPTRETARDHRSIESNTNPRQKRPVGPKPPLASFTQPMSLGSPMPSWRSGSTHGFCIHRRAFADCFGSQPRLLGFSTRFDPGAAHRTDHGVGVAAWSFLLICDCPLSEVEML
jgi:hypothetical protein